MKKWIAYSVVTALACTALAQTLPPVPNMNDQRPPNAQGGPGGGPGGPAAMNAPAT